MKLVPWSKNRSTSLSPFRDFDSIVDEMNSIFSSPISKYFDRSMGEFANTWAPPIDVIDKDDHLEVKADLPGLDKKDIDVSLHGDVLLIKGSKEVTKDEDKDGYVFSERSFGSFSRSVSLPSSVDASKIDASYKDGVLHLNIPKKEEEKSKGTKIDIK